MGGGGGGGGGVDVRNPGGYRCLPRTDISTRKVRHLDGFPYVWD